MGKMIQKLFLAAAAVLWCFDTTHADANANATLFTWVSESVGGGGGWARRCTRTYSIW